MNRSLALFAIGLVFGGAAGFVGAAANGITLDGHDHGSHGNMKHASMDRSEMNHDALLPVDAENAPVLTIAVTTDPMSGWNLNIETDNFQFAPENASSAHVIPKKEIIDPFDGVKPVHSGRRGAQRDTVYQASDATHQMDGFGPPKAGFSSPLDFVMLHLYQASPILTHMTGISAGFG